MNRISEIYPSRFLRLDDMPEGRDVRLKISTATSEPVGNTGEHKPVLGFHGTAKAFVVNRTNAKAMAARLGDRLTDWPGHEVILSVGTSEFNGARMICVKFPRASDPLAQTQPSPKTPPRDDMSDEIPF
jgi:hypothetical protein